MKGAAGFAGGTAVKALGLGASPAGGVVWVLGGEGGVKGTWVGAVPTELVGVAGVGLTGGDAEEAAFAGGGAAGAAGLAPPGRTTGLESLMLGLVLALSAKARYRIVSSYSDFNA